MPKTPFPPPPQMSTSEAPDPLLERTQQVQPYLPQEVISKIVLDGDLKGLTQEQMTAYYIHRCRNLGLDPATKPFDVLTLQGKKILYANKQCAMQLRALNKLSTAVLEEREWNGLLVIRVRAWAPDGRQHEDEGYASVAGLGGDQLGNARLKAITKANRRAILGLCGLGELDETEVETIPGARTSAFAEAKQALTQLQIKQVAATGTDIIKIADIRGADANTDTLEVLDVHGRVWHFQGQDTMGVALANIANDRDIHVEYTVENGQYTVRSAHV